MLQTGIVLDLCAIANITINKIMCSASRRAQNVWENDHKICMIFTWSVHCVVVVAISEHFNRILRPFPSHIECQLNQSDRIILVLAGIQCGSGKLLYSFCFFFATGRPVTNRPIVNARKVKQTCACTRQLPYAQPTHLPGYCTISVETSCRVYIRSALTGCRTQQLVEVCFEISVQFGSGISQLRGAPSIFVSVSCVFV